MRKWIYQATNQNVTSRGFIKAIPGRKTQIIFHVTL